MTRSRRSKPPSTTGESVPATLAGRPADDRPAPMDRPQPAATIEPTADTPAPVVEAVALGSEPDREPLADRDPLANREPFAPATAEPLRQLERDGPSVMAASSSTDSDRGGRARDGGGGFGDTTPPSSAAYRGADVPRERSIWPAALLGGLLGGGVVAAAGGWYVTTRPFVPPVLLSRIEALEAGGVRVDTLATDAGSLRERTEAAAGNIGNLQSRLAAVEQAGAAAPQRIETLELAVRELRAGLEGTRGTTDTVAGDFRGRLDELRTRLDAVAQETTRLGQAGSDAAGAAQRLAGLDEAQRGAAVTASELKGVLDQLRADLGGLERRLGEAQEGARQEVAGVRQSVDQLGGRVQALEGLTATVAALQQAGGAREAAIAQAREEVETLRSDVDQRVAALQANAGQVTEEARRLVVEQAEAAERASALALAAYELRVALERGGGVQPSIELIRRNAGGDADLGLIADRLDGLRGEGVPSVGQLQAGLDEVEAAAAAAAAVPAPAADDGGEPGWLGQARRNLGSLVELRAPGEAAPPQAADAVAGAREALLAGDLAAAATALEPLAGAGNERARAWIEAATRRQLASGAVEQLADRARAGGGDTAAAADGGGDPGAAAAPQ